ncbi:ArsR/SmtB family transcription factor [Alkalihalobacillus pseudalcaliphilus]|uniref:ArsR/SmtB family transcription factor n=1 Tax=Alkalihalobacillus pseudalcaliphilus TaxID=79884 RepID=UPI00064DF609|nr:winged helix-turn-helix domain-containing protein [Alkalihalobacillus pseudalcaliphilus]KMK76641.1 transcriptional regulator [Alkalihalobacillus pseudalcaliphilus]
MIQIQNGDQLLLVLEALSNPYRLKILAILNQEKQYVSQLARDLQISRPLLYLHLKKLEEAELVQGHHEISEFGKAMKYFEVTELSLLLNNQMIEEYAQTLTLKNKNNQ